MRIILILIALFSANYVINCTEINFSDSEFERYLLNEKCIFANSNNDSLFSPDKNKDGLLQIEEALQIKNLKISDFDRNYSIKNITDLNQIPNIESLEIIYNDSLVSFDRLNLNSLHTLFIADCAIMNSIDISNLPDLRTSIRIEGLTKLKYLNLHNGSVANEFSMFYTINVEYACIDNLEKEIKVLDDSGTMKAGISPIFYCGTTDINSMNIEDRFDLVLNDGVIATTNKLNNSKYEILDYSGKSIVNAAISNSSIDVNNLKSGLYLLSINYNSENFIYRFAVE